MIKKLFILFLTVSLIAILLGTAFGKEFQPFTLSNTLRIISEADISFEASFSSIDDIKEVAERIDTFDMNNYFSSNKVADDDDVLTAIKKIFTNLYNTIVDFFNCIVDFFIMLWYAILMVVTFVYDSLLNIVAVLGIVFKLFGMSSYV